MSSTKATQTGDHPTPESIIDVMTACNCSKSRAIALLEASIHLPKSNLKHHANYYQHCGNDRKKAKQHYRALASYMSFSGSGQIQRSPGTFTTRNRNTTINFTNGREDSEVEEEGEDKGGGGGEEDEIPTDDDTTTDKQILTVEEEKIPWNFVLPIIPPPDNLMPYIENGVPEFSLSDLVGALQAGATPQMIQNYLGNFDENVVKQYINGTVSGFPAIFFAAATNNEWVLRKWISYGGDVNAIHEDSKIPLLVYAIMHAETLQSDTTLTVATLLSLGASPLSIPKAFYSEFCKDLPENGPTDEEFEDITDGNMEWATNSEARSKLARTANLTQRYFLKRAHITKKPTTRHRQVAERRNAAPLLGIPYFLIGQTEAANRLLRKLLSHLLIPSKKPLVLVFAGPSGHGKTELARRLGHLLSVELEVVDCTHFNKEIELFGPRNPYVGAGQGSALNNFLARNAGERSIVFLDEFEKTSADVHQALLLPFDNGEYQDRRNLTKIDCSPTIWILAVNALDATIQKFCAQNRDVIFVEGEDLEKGQLMADLSKELKENFMLRFDFPLTGRISAFIPFLPFSLAEQAVVAHKYILELGQKIREPVILTPDARERLLGNVILRVVGDATVCQFLAKKGYHFDLGARSLITTVKEEVEDMLVEMYLDVDEEIREGLDLAQFSVSVSGGRIVGNLTNPPDRGGIAKED